MKKIIFSLLILCALSALVVSSCQKKYSNIGTPQSLNQLFADLRTTPQNFTVQAGRDTVIYGTQGTILHFYSNSFKTEVGSIITNSSISVQLVEMYKPGDMICNLASTMTTDNYLLQSGGQVNITVTENGQKVYANKYGIGFIQPAPSLQPMELYYGSNANSDSVTKWTKGNNITPGTTTSQTTYYFDSTTYHLNLSPCYMFDSCSGFDCVNCDFFSVSKEYQQTTQAHFSVILPDASFQHFNTVVFIYFKTINSVFIDARYDIPTHTIVFEAPHSVPIGWEYKLGIINRKDNGYSYFETSGTITDGSTITAVMTPKSHNDIMAILQGL